ncbi:MAG TPA: EipA family protein [Caulobacteraceae bacterium]|jgi:hypothetical protein
MDRRTLILAAAAGAGLLARPGWAQTTAASAELPEDGQLTGAPPPPSPRMTVEPSYATPETFSREEISRSVSDFMGVTAEGAGAVVERLFRENGRPTGYIAGEEGSAAFALGLRYGKGLLHMKGREPQVVYWRGGSIGWDFGGNASRVLTLVYGMHVPEMLYRHFPGVEGSAYLIGGMGVNYQRAEGVTLAPMRAGVGVRLGANVGWLAYSAKRSFLPV